MQKITNFPASASLAEFIDELCPTDQHIYVTSRAVYADDDYTGRFTGLFVESETTYCNIVRAFTVKGVTYHTLEKWEHDNGYRCTLEVLTLAQFKAYINGTGLFL